MAVEPSIEDLRGIEFSVEYNKDLERTEITFVNYDTQKSAGTFIEGSCSFQDLFKWVNHCLRESR